MRRTTLDDAGQPVRPAEDATKDFSAMAPSLLDRRGGT
jgi:hypothetical protein